MGYTHYWYKKPELDATRWAAFVADCRKIIEAVDGTTSETAGGYHKDDAVRLVYEYDEVKKKPELSPDLVRFNGAGGLGHETFYFERVVAKGDMGTVRNGRVFSFCKTARKPYDVAVTACLIAAKHCFGDDIKISSDGDDLCWMAGCELCQKTVGYGGNFKIHSDREEV